MIKTLQYFIFIVLIITSIIFFKKNFSTKKNMDINTNRNIDTKISQTKNNIIKNLNYSILLDNKIKYEISSKQSEIEYVNNQEIVNMDKVLAIIIDKNKNKLIIKSDRARYNNENFNSYFYDNVIIEFADHKIFSDKSEIRLNDNIILIYDNVYYVDKENTLTADVIKYDLISKKIDISMNSDNNNIEILANNVQY